MDTSRVIGIATAALILLLAGCGGGGGEVPDFPNLGTLALQITDAPFFEEGECIQEAWITVDGVSVKSSEGVFIDLDLVPPAEPWEPAPENPDDVVPAVVQRSDGKLEIDLLRLTNAVTAELAAGALPIGTYSEIRLHVSDTRLVFAEDDPETPTVDEGDTQHFAVPSGTASGLKIKIDPSFVVDEKQTTVLDLDFNLARSFHVTGQGGEPSCEDLKGGQGGVRYVPTIRVVNRSNAGILEGVVYEEVAESRARGQVTVTAIRRDAPSGAVDEFSTVSAGPDSEFGEEGYFALILEAGEYDLYLGPTDGEPAAAGVFVVPGEVTTRDLQIPALP